MERAQEYLERALNMCREQGDLRGEGWALNNLGRVYSVLGQRERAREYFEQALQICREMGDRGDEVMNLNSLAGIHRALAQRMKSLEQSLQICKGLDRWGEGKTLNNLGQVFAGMGQKELALEYLGRALTIRREVGDHGGEATTLNDLGKLYADLGQQEQALKCYRQALKMRRDTDDREGEGSTLHNLGVFYFKQEKYDVALASFLLAKSIFEEVQGPERDETQGCIDSLREAMGEQQFATLLAQVEPQAWQIVEEALRKEL